MKVPIEADRIRIKDGEVILEETCYESRADLARLPDGRKLSIVTLRKYHSGARHWLLGEDGWEHEALVDSISVATRSGYNLVTFSVVIPQIRQDQL